MKKTVSLLLAALLLLLAYPAAAAQQTLNYGGNDISCLTLTDFTDGNVVGEASGSGTMAVTDGILTMACNSGGYVECYSFYDGGNIAAAEVADAVWIGFSVKNCSDADIHFAFQGTRQGGAKFRMSNQGEDMLLANANGQVAKAQAVVSNNRIAAVLPANFEGALLLPTSRVSTSMNNPPDWNNGGNKSFYTLGFYIKDNGSTGQGIVEINDMFMIDEVLPEVEFVEQFTDITNPEYSYTDQQRIQAFWTENVMYNETVCMLQEGDVISAHALFTPTRIISVVNNALNKEYKEGVDYTWVEGTNELRWLEGSSIPYFYEGALMGLKEEGSTEYVKDWDGSFDETGRCRLGGVLYCVGPFVYQKQIAITYEYDLSQAEDISVASYQGDRLPTFTQKLKNGEEVGILFYGSSSFQGADASGFHGRAPYMPILSDLMGNYLNDNGMPAKITNLGVGGWNTGAGLAALKGETSYTAGGQSRPVNGTDGKPVGDRYQQIAQAGDYDLVIIGFFAGNNYGVGINAEQFKADIEAMMDIFRENNPQCEFLILTGMVTNPKDTYTPAYVEKAYEIAGEEHALVDMYKTHSDILKTKDFISTSGNNINHGNDWLIRVTAQNMLSAMVENFGGERAMQSPEPSPGNTPTAQTPAATPTNPGSTASAGTPSATSSADNPSQSGNIALYAVIAGIAVIGAVLACVLAVRRKKKI